MRKFYFLSTALLFCFINCFSQAGMLDPSFGDKGMVYTNTRDDVNKQDEHIRAIAIQHDGKIVAVGSGKPAGGSTQATILRYSANGTLDNSFDNDGMAFFFRTEFNAVAIQSDGKIVVAGSTRNLPNNNYRFSLLRFNTNGHPDNSFGFNGKVVTDFNSANAVAVSISIQSDGKIVAAGYSNTGTANKFAMARYNPDGSLDNTFDGDGRLTNNFNAVNSIALQTDGKIIAAGSANSGSYNVFSLIRLNQDGSPDNSFNGNGNITTVIGSYGSIINSVTLQSDGKIVAAGLSKTLNVNNNYINSFTIARYNTNGSLDNSFDNDGIVITSFNGSSGDVKTVAIQNDGKITAAGQSGLSFALVRYNSNGSNDNSFDGDGILVTTNNSVYNKLSGMALQPDGKIITAGSSESPATFYDDFALARLNNDGSFDNSFDGDGKVITNIGSSFDRPQALTVQNDGKIVAAGYGATVDLGHANRIALVRYNTDGTLDNSFDGDGKVTTQVSNWNTGEDVANAVAVLNDGKILVLATSYFTGGNEYDFTLLRYNPDGSLDNSFDGDGKLSINFGGLDYAECIAIQEDGKIVVAGNTENGNARDFILARFNSDGSFDNSFDGDGKLIMSLSPNADVLTSLKIQGDGKIVVGGFFYNVTNYDFFVARFNSNGSLDNSFDGDGIVKTDINSSADRLGSVSIQNDGKIVAIGGAGNNMAIVRYNVNGSLDNSFANNGKLLLGTPSQMYFSGDVQSDGKIVACGGTGDFIVARYNNDGSPDNSFDGDGKAVLGLWEGSYKHYHAMKLYGNRIYLLGDTYLVGNSDFILAAVFAAPPSAPSLLLVDFSGKLVNNDAVLNWNTKNESNMLEYVVERSVDGRNFVPVDYTNARNTAGTNYYAVTDYNVASLRSSVIYYRLKQKGLDGSFTYSRIVVLPVDKSLILFYPNPVINEANLVFTLNRQTKVLVRIIDNKGRIVQQQQLNLSAGNTSLSMDVTTLARGIYYLVLRGEGIDYTKKFVK
jgi:uncharacterized delta-60 repeat protein